MKVLYAIQGTGNGHLSRAQDVIIALRNRVEVDILISGIQSDLELPYPVQHRYHGLSFIFGQNGGVDFLKSFKRNHLARFLKEVRHCPVRNYDLIINDFEPITAWACKYRGKKCVSLSHQAALSCSNVPKPKHKDWLGSFVLRNYAPCHDYYGFHFEAYQEKFFTPVIRAEVRNQPISHKAHYTVYLPAYGDIKIIEILSQIPGVDWQIFSKHTQHSYRSGNIQIQPINSPKFIASMASAEGVLCGAGFETPAEALFLRKKLMVIPMKWQYEQHYNAASLKKLGVPIVDKLDQTGVERIRDWVVNSDILELNFPDQTQVIIDTLLAQYMHVPERILSMQTTALRAKNMLGASKR